MVGRCVCEVSRLASLLSRTPCIARWRPCCLHHSPARPFALGIFFLPHTLLTLFDRLLWRREKQGPDMKCHPEVHTSGSHSQNLDPRFSLPHSSPKQQDQPNRSIEQDHFNPELLVICTKLDKIRSISGNKSCGSPYMSEWGLRSTASSETRRQVSNRRALASCPPSGYYFPARKKSITTEAHSINSQAGRGRNFS